MRFLLSCNELGLGHVSRIILLGKRLEKRGHDLFFFSGGIAYELLQDKFKNVYHCTPVTWYENAQGVIVSASLLNILIPLPRFNDKENSFNLKKSSAAETIHRYYDLRRYIRKIRPDCIVSDGDMHALRLAHRWKFPSVYITNLIRPTYGFPPFLMPGERFTERYVRKSTKIIVPDNPMPYTICEYNLGDLSRMKIKDKVTFVGSFLDLAPINGREDYVFAPISGPFGTRAKLMKTIIPAFKKLGIKSVVSLGEPGRKISKKIGNCEIHTWLSEEERQEYMKNSRLIVFSGGHITCFEIIKYVKPSVCIPTQSEQMGNARKMQEMGCLMVAENEQQLRLAIEEMEERKRLCQVSVETLNEYSNQFRGLDETVATIEEIVKV